MQAGIYLNETYRSQAESFVYKITGALEEHEISCKTLKANEDVEGLDVLIVLGGDGTILKVAAECARSGVKILGINCGHMGFLADFEADEIDKAISLLLSGNYSTVSRSLLKVETNGECFYGLNEAVIQRSTSGNTFTTTVNLHAEIDGSTVDTFSSDGLIISTPTGSTAYSLSAGGSILTPDLSAFILTPICPHSLHSRPIVFSDNSKVKITQFGRKSELSLIVDGRVVGTVHGDQSIIVSKAEKRLEFISFIDDNFFDKLLIKLNIWSK